MRHRTRGFGLLTCCAAGMLGCAGSPDEIAADTTTAVPGGAVAEAARAAKQAIRAQETRWRDVVTRRDTAAIASFYTEDAVYAPDFSPPIRGRVVPGWCQTHERAPNR